MHSSRINLRVDDGLKKFMIVVCKARNISYTTLIEEALITSLKTSKQYLKDNLLKELVDYEKRVKLDRLRKQLLIKNRNRFIISNYIKRIYRLAFADRQNGRDPNMKVIKNLVNEALEEFELFPEDVKKELQSEMDHLKDIKDLKTLNYRMNSMKELIK